MFSPNKGFILLSPDTDIVETNVRLVPVTAFNNDIGLFYKQIILSTFYW